MFVNTNPEKLRELPVKMILRECRNAAELIDSKVVIQMSINVLKHLAESSVIGVNSRCSQ